MVDDRYDLGWSDGRSPRFKGPSTAPGSSGLAQTPGCVPIARGA
jgi:hypothetical protein